MARGYLSGDRDQRFLMPPDMREWLPSDHLVWTVLEVIDQLDTSEFHQLSRRGGAGRAGFDPDVLLAVLVLGYCTGQRSSRQLERLCAQDVAFRVASAGVMPDHTVLARFRQAHAAAFVELFSQVLVLAAGHGLVRLDTVAVDGTKIAANASLDANRDERWVREQARKIVEQAQAVDAAEDEVFGDARGDESDPVMADPASRKQRVAQWLEELQSAQNDRSRSLAERDERVEQRKAQLAQGKPPSGRYPGTLQQRAEQARIVLERAVEQRQAKVDADARARAQGPVARARPKPVEHSAEIKRLRANYERLQQQAEAAVTDPPRVGRRDRDASAFRVNTTDPQSRVLGSRRGWVQGYNVQVAVTGGQLIVACSVGRSNDVGQFVPMMTATGHAQTLIEAATGNPYPIGTMLADAGYASIANLTADGPDRLIALGKGRDQARHNPVDGSPPSDADPRRQMQHRLDTEQGKALYKRRAATVEPAIGNLKKIMDRFSMRGLDAANAETHLAAACFNILKIHRAPA